MNTPNKITVAYRIYKIDRSGLMTIPQKDSYGSKYDMFDDYDNESEAYAAIADEPEASYSTFLIVKIVSTYGS